MQFGDRTRVARDVVRREWWLVAIVIAGAVVGAALMGGGAKTTYQAQTTFLADTTILNRYKGIPTPDDVVRDVGTPAARASIAEVLGLKASDVSGLRLSGFGNPQNRLLVSFSSPDRDRALAVVRAADDAVLQYVAKRTVVERVNYQTAVDQADVTIARLESALGEASLVRWQRSDVEFKLWQVRQSRIQSKDIVDILSGVYQVHIEPSAVATSGSSALVTRSAAAVLVGLFLGLVLAGGREWLLRRWGTARP